MSGAALLAIAGGLGLLVLAIVAFRKALPKRATPASAANNWRRVEPTAVNGELRDDTIATEVVGIELGGSQ